MGAFANPPIADGKASGAPEATAILPWLWIPLGAFAVQLGLVYGVARLHGAADVLPALMVLSHLLLVPFLLRNFRYVGMRLILLGLALNLTVMLANGGLMPVTAAGVNAVGRHDPAELTTGAHIAGSKDALLDPADVRLPQLSDAIVLPLPRPYTRVISLGDIFIGAGMVIALASITRRLLADTRRLNVTPVAA